MVLSSKIIPSGQSVKEVSQICELFGIIGEKENRRGEEEWNSGSRITGETW